MPDDAEPALTSSKEISELLSMLPDSINDKKKVSEDLSDLNQAHYQSSSSGNSSPMRELEPLGISVEDIDMWDVLDCLEGKSTACLPKLQLPHLPCESAGPIRNGPTDDKESCHLNSRPASSSNMSSLDDKGDGAPLSKSFHEPTLNPHSSPSRGRVAAKGAGSKRPASKLEVKKETNDDLCSDGECDNSPMMDLQGQPLDPNEEKRLKRMRRNRESAAMSRNRKKMYIEELEARVVELTANVQQLQQQNAALQQENAALRAGSSTAQDAHVDVLVSDGSSATPAVASTRVREGDDGSESRGEERHPTTSSGKKSGVSAASLALMSALTFVTFSAVQSGRSQTKHGPGARSLMSVDEMPPIPESISGLLQRARSTAALVGEEPLWPALKPFIERSGRLLSVEDTKTVETVDDEADGETASQSEGSSVPPAFKLSPSTTSSRVIKLPQNSSWGDALRFEALESSLARRVERAVTDFEEERALVHHESTTHADMSEEWSKPTRIFDSIWSKVDEDDQFAVDEEHDAQRYIFCSRAYMFDAVEPFGNRRITSQGSRASSAPLPASMPARFRHAAQQQVPRLTNGNTNVTPQSAIPTVQFLLPSAALHGIAGTDVQLGADTNHRAEELLQVTCQVTNVSRVAQTA